MGAGFHPELTGRENIYLNGEILGMHRAEIARRFDEIERFLDTPVKRLRSVQQYAFGVCAWRSPWPRTWSRRSYWWTRACPFGALRASSEQALSKL